MLESIVAIFILSLSISGVFSAVQQGLSQTIIAKDEVKAFYLAQEAVEIIRNKRDNNQLNRISTGAGYWLDGIAGSLGDPCFNQICRADATGPGSPPVFLYACGMWGDCPVLKQDQSAYLYNYATGNPTNFKREIQIESVAADEIAVTVKITWTKGLASKEFKVKTILFDWIDI